VPDRPNDNASKQMTVKFIELQDRKIVTQMFEENPVWYDLFLTFFG
jgi:hypothetical protein